MGKIIAIVGGGGKTTSMMSLSRYLSGQRVLLTTTTHIVPVEPPECREFLPDPEEMQLFTALQKPGVVCSGHLGAWGKLCGLSIPMLRNAAAAADWTLCEADGAHRMPLKLHNGGEPVIPANTDLLLIVAGLSAIHKPVCRAIHRFELNPWWKEQSLKEVTGEDLLLCIRETVAVSKVPKDRVKILLNQQDMLEKPQMGNELAERLQNEGYRACAGSMKTEPEKLCAWIIS